jgi:hypothetical protein
MHIRQRYHLLREPLVQVLKAAGVECVFGIISVHNNPIYDAIARQGGIRTITNRREAGAVNMADGYAKAKGTLGVVITSTGAVAGNAAGSLIEAQTNGTPLLHITGQIDSPYLDQAKGFIHECKDQLGMLKAISKEAFRVRSIGSLATTVLQAIEVALTAPSGVVSVEVPIDNQKRLAKERGTRLYLETQLTRANKVGSIWQVETVNGTFEGAYLVNTAGPWAGEVAARAGLEVPIHPVRRMVYAIAPTSWNHNYPLTIDLESGFYLRSEGNRVLFGRSNPNEPPGFTQGIDWDWLEPTLQVGAARFPWLAEIRLDHHACWWGYYEVTPDHNPILGRLPAAENWINAAGFSGHGVQQAPMVGKLIDEEIALWKAQSVNIDHLRIDRLFEKQMQKEHNIV